MGSADSWPFSIPIRQWEKLDQRIMDRVQGAPGNDFFRWWSRQDMCILCFKRVFRWNIWRRNQNACGWGGQWTSEGASKKILTRPIVMSAHPPLLVFTVYIHHPPCHLRQWTRLFVVLSENHHPNALFGGSWNNAINIDAWDKDSVRDQEQYVRPRRLSESYKCTEPKKIVNGQLTSTIVSFRVFGQDCWNSEQHTHCKNGHWHNGVYYEVAHQKTQMHKGNISS